MLLSDYQLQIASDFFSQFALGKPLPTPEWAEKYVNFSLDATASKKFFESRPYQIPILQAADDKNVEQITVISSPRLGKSMLWKIILARRIFYGNESALVVYQSSEEAEKANRDTLLPLMMGIPKLRHDLDIPRSKSSDSYHFTDCNSVIYFQGSGSPIVSKSARMGVADELSYWARTGAGEGTKVWDNLQMLRTRGQTFTDKGRLLFISGTPTWTSETLWQEYLKGTQEEFHLICLDCGMLLPCSRIAYPLQNGTFAGLQWRKEDDEKTVIVDSIRFICPRCNHSHVWQDAMRMAMEGKYVAEHPERIDHRSFHANALATPWTWSWKEIARGQEMAKVPEGRIYFRNTLMGLPVSHEASEDGDAKDIVKAHMRPRPKDEDIHIVLASVDVQGHEGSNYYIYCVRGWLDNGDNFLLAHGMAQSFDELKKVIEADYAGQKIFLTGIDQGGFSHTGTKLELFVINQPRVTWLKGDTTAAVVKTKKIDFSENLHKLLLLDSNHFKVVLLDAIYANAVQTGDGNYWMIPDDVSAMYLSQIKAMKPSLKRANGTAFQNWAPGAIQHDYFDTEKYLTALMEFCFLNLRAPNLWPKGCYPKFIKDRLYVEIQIEEASGNLRRNA